MGLPLVVGVDGSDSSLLAVDWAVDEAARHGLPLHLVHAFKWERYERGLTSLATGRGAGEVMAQNIVASCARRAGLRNPEVRVSEDVVPDDAVAALLRASPDAFALVVGERGRGEVTGLLLGSVSLTVAARAVCPVVVVRGEQPNVRGTLGRIAVGVGDSVERTAAVRFAAREAQARGCALTAVRAWRRPAHEREDHPPAARDTAAADHGRGSTEGEDVLRDVVREHPGLSVHRRTAEGPAHRVLLGAAADADMIVVGARRRHGPFGLQLGRTAHALLHHSACPVAVVPQRV